MWCLRGNTSTTGYASSDTCVYVVPEKTLDAFRGASGRARLAGRKVVVLYAVDPVSYCSREEFSGAAGYEAPLEPGPSGTPRVSPGVDSLNCGRKGSEGKGTQGESVEIWVGKASSKVVVLDSKVQGRSSPLPQAQASGPRQTTLDETAHTRQMFSVPELQTPSTSFCNDEVCRRTAAALRSHHSDPVDSIGDRRLGLRLRRIDLWSQNTQLHHADCDCESGHVEEFHVARTQAYHSPTRVVPDANGGKEEEEGSVLGAVPRHAPDSTGRSAQSAAGAGL
ncbi:hypothetical protein EDB92DRAFT_1818862 [Lactarius akahatsu]|uniref:Uncharacterized protein n=1 Tax=Lactarius akahatsu TaxID=416441 RepID=A0AAD4L9V9_9AGAM|nr:hypothetical protein EDB92DRAFT_1818862 [Lactarius akahatsu]